MYLQWRAYMQIETIHFAVRKLVLACCGRSELLSTVIIANVYSAAPMRTWHSFSLTCKYHTRQIQLKKTVT